MIPAFSGKRGSSRYGDPTTTETYECDPIPEGHYSINPGDVVQVLPSGSLGGYLPGYVADNQDDWGYYRVGLMPDKALAAKIRAGGREAHKGSFCLHGGTWVGSGGCIDIGPNDVKVFPLLAEHYGLINVVVDYSGWTGTVPGSLGKNGKNWFWKVWLHTYTGPYMAPPEPTPTPTPTGGVTDMKCK